MGTSTRPVLTILPTRENIIVPLLPAVPTWEYHSAPLFIINGTLAQVLTLFSRLGLSQSPFSDIWIYLALGSPILPSREAIRALDSPQTKAPPPLFMVILKSKPEPKIFLPSSP